MGDTGVACTQAELYRLLRFIEREVFESSRSLGEAKAKWKAIREHIEELTIDDLRRELGI